MVIYSSQNRYVENITNPDIMRELVGRELLPEQRVYLERVMLLTDGLIGDFWEPKLAKEIAVKYYNEMYQAREPKLGDSFFTTGDLRTGEYLRGGHPPKFYKTPSTISKAVNIKSGVGIALLAGGIIVAVLAALNTYSSLAATPREQANFTFLTALTTVQNRY